MTVSMRGDYGKPRPALVIQSKAFDDLDSVTFLPLTSDVTSTRTFRILVSPSVADGLHSESQVMADKCTTLPLSKVGPVFGQLSAIDQDRVDRALALFLGFA